MIIVTQTFDISFERPVDRAEYLLKLKALQDAVVEASKVVGSLCVSFGQPKEKEL